MSLIKKFLNSLDWQHLSSMNDAASFPDFMSVVSNNILEFVPTKIVKPYTSESTVPYFLLPRLKKLTFFNLITSLRNEQQSVVVIYFDLSKAFDKVPYRRLLVKLEALGIQSPLLNFIGSYLSNRSQKVLVALTTLDNLDTFLRFCNSDDGLQVQLMIKADCDGFSSLIGGLCSQQGRISLMIS
ncbi:unnamed protein product [Schistocephalus solidus]|uniref:Reverse transcriptase domain-containing protein n=1 Tax=Schistocephalus solidus TaxID=70667 RepID=A0A183TA08_SCHSO|nr:unnamed protein product [Schistocephalus solidus]